MNHDVNTEKRNGLNGETCKRVTDYEVLLYFKLSLSTAMKINYI